MVERYPQRRANRLRAYDYSAPGAYFITICTEGRKCILSDITVGEGLAPPEPRLTTIGQLVEGQILDLHHRYTSVSIDKYTIMPNHIHLLMSLSQTEDTGGASPSPTVADAVRTMKSITSRMCSSQFGMKPLWQRSYHDHVIRNERDYLEIWQYIDENPARWAEDCYAP